MIANESVMQVNVVSVQMEAQSFGSGVILKSYLHVNVNVKVILANMNA